MGVKSELDSPLMSVERSPWNEGKEGQAQPTEMGRDPNREEWDETQKERID